MNFQKYYLLIISVFLVSCGVRKYDYNKFSKLGKKNFQLELNSEKYNPTNTILDVKNVSNVKINRKNKTILVQTIEKPKFVTVKKISDSIKNDKISLAIIYGWIFSKDDFENIIIEKKAIDSLRILEIPISCNGNVGLVIKVK